MGTRIVRLSDGARSPICACKTRGSTSWWRKLSFAYCPAAGAGGSANVSRVLRPYYASQGEEPGNPAAMKTDTACLVEYLSRRGHAIRMEEERRLCMGENHQRLTPEFRERLRYPLAMVKSPEFVMVPKEMEDDAITAVMFGKPGRRVGRTFAGYRDRQGKLSLHIPVLAARPT